MADLLTSDISMQSLHYLAKVHRRLGLLFWCRAGTVYWSLMLELLYFSFPSFSLSPLLMMNEVTDRKSWLWSLCETGWTSLFVLCDFSVLQHCSLLSTTYSSKYSVTVETGQTLSTVLLIICEEPNASFPHSSVYVSPCLPMKTSVIFHVFVKLRLPYFFQVLNLRRVHWKMWTFVADFGLTACTVCHKKLAFHDQLV